MLKATLQHNQFPRAIIPIIPCPRLISRICLSFGFKDQALIEVGTKKKDPNLVFESISEPLSGTIYLSSTRLISVILAKHQNSFMRTILSSAFFWIHHGWLTHSNVRSIISSLVVWSCWETRDDIISRPRLQSIQFEQSAFVILLTRIDQIIIPSCGSIY